jgi:hypothetical protein
MIDLFYFIGLFVFLISLTYLTNFSKISELRKWSNAFKKVTKTNPQKKDFKTDEDYNLFIGIGCLSIFEGIWVLIGLLTQNWILFLLLIILNYISVYSFKSDITRIFGFTSSITKSLIIFLLVINHFHLKIDITNIIFNFFI